MQQGSISERVAVGNKIMNGKCQRVHRRVMTIAKPLGFDITGRSLIILTKKTN
jgi:hypothetical protein